MRLTNDKEPKHFGVAFAKAKGMTWSFGILCMRLPKN
jgi:hypothetical protein